MKFLKKNFFFKETNIILSKIKWLEGLIKYRRGDIHIINVEVEKYNNLVLEGFLKQVFERYKKLNLKCFKCIVVFKALTGLKKSVILNCNSNFSPKDQKFLTKNIQTEFEFLNLCHFDETVTIVEVSLHMVFIDDDFVDKWKNVLYVWELARMGYFTYKDKYFTLP